MMKFERFNVGERVVISRNKGLTGVISSHYGYVPLYGDSPLWTILLDEPNENGGFFTFAHEDDIARAEQ